MVSKRTLRLIIPLIIVVIVAAGVAIGMTLISPPSPEIREFKLGVVLDKTGPFAPCAEIQELGVRLAVDEINSKGGLLGKIPVTIVVRDGESKPEVQVLRGRELAEVEKVNAIVGTCHAGGGYNLMVESAKLGVPFWPLAVVALRAFNKSDRVEWMFNAMMSPWSIGYTVCSYAINELQTKRIFFLARTDAWGWDQRDGCRAAISNYGGEMVGYEEFPLGTPDFTPYIAKIRAAKPDIVVSTTFGADQTLFLKQAYETGLSRETKIFITFFTNIAAAGVPPEALKGVYGLHFYYYDVPRGLVDNDTYNTIQEFNRMFINKYGRPPDAYTLLAYLNVKALLQAFEKLGKFTGVTPQEFSKVLVGTSMMTPKGKMTWRVDGQALFDYAVFVVVGKGPDERTSQWDLFKVVGVYRGADYLPPLKMLGYE